MSKKHKLTAKHEIREDLYTQAEYARLNGWSRAYVNKMVKDGNFSSCRIKGGILVKVTTTLN